MKKCFWVAQRSQRCERLAVSETALAAEVPWSHRPEATPDTASTSSPLPPFSEGSSFAENRSRLFVEVLFHYRDQKNYLLHEFVLMPDHFHVLISPTLSLERSLQLIKGGFSYRARKELGFASEIWEKSFYDRRVRGAEDYYNFKQYIRQNPIKEGLVTTISDYPCSSAGQNVRWTRSLRG